MIGFDAIIYFLSILQAAQFESLQFIFWHQKIKKCCLSSPITVTLPIHEKKFGLDRLRRFHNKIRGKGYINHENSNMRGKTKKIDYKLIRIL